MRATLVDWIVQVHDRFRLLPETLFLSVQLMDRFLGQHRVAIPKLQLVGITSLWVASKYEEIQVPTLAHLDYMCDGTYPPSEFVKAESFLLMTLRYELGGPNPLLYLRRIARADVGDARRARHMAKYYLEVALMHLTMLQWRPSRIAAAAMWLAYRALSTAPATPSMLASTLSGYREVDLLPVAEALFDLVRQPEQHPAIYAKFSTQSRWYAAPWMKQCGVRNVLATVQKQ
ncbi:hypothetical protein CXG81DRAFT_15584 [Caulochytrium protostelioides]|uniref:Uncharacterized protein n=1 Tax=Caulochytrium protostelioides TaxID=1555241 RepID=A0A4P9X1C4_9FUNG|nr:hypothetical protein CAUPRSCDRAFT_6405 [Caulochytrium protostelioides]RKO98683.1 hypothetical protein CXG81DRAFT_15584 [Caulochytrium protostelioides]|eukprot:RKO98683.1 hypothetical protein CXG81DRAFT_15584 [Caulochytrium protostelioides]